MNLLDNIRSVDDHALVTWLFCEIRRGRFPSVCALMWANSHVGRDELEDIAAEVGAILRGKGTHRSRADRLGRLGVQVAKRHRVGWPDERHPQRELVDGIFGLAGRQREPADANRSRLALPGFIVGAVELALASGIALDKLMTNPEGLIEVVREAAKANGVWVSLTDVRDTLLYGMTCFGPITDWVSSEVVDGLREQEHSHLIDLLRSRRGSAFLREFLSLPGAGDWLLDQMRTDDERSLLRAALRNAYRSKKVKRSPPPKPATH